MKSYKIRGLHKGFAMDSQHFQCNFIVFNIKSYRIRDEFMENK